MTLCQQPDCGHPSGTICTYAMCPGRGLQARSNLSDRAVCCPACRHVFQRLAIYREIWTLDDTRRLREMHRAGLTFAQMARELGRTRSGVAGKVKRMGLAS